MSSRGDTGPRDPVGDDSTGPGWGAAALIGFRFGTCYFGAFGLVVAVGLIPVVLKGAGVDGPWSAIREIFHAARGPIAWIGEHLLGLRVQSAQVGSDSAFQWTALFRIACLALVATAIWTVLDRDRLAAMTAYSRGCGQCCGWCSPRPCSISEWRRSSRRRCLSC